MIGIPGFSTGLAAPDMVRPRLPRVRPAPDRFRYVLMDCVGGVERWRERGK
jgi:hypothetical protein